MEHSMNTETIAIPIDIYKVLFSLAQEQINGTLSEGPNHYSN